MADGWKPCPMSPRTAERKGRKSIHRTDTGHYVIADADVWLPGIFADRATAITGLGYSIDVLSELQKAANERGRDFYERVITAADLAAAKREKEAGDE